MPCCRASCTAAAQSGSGIGERCARVLRQRSNCWRACSILTGTTGVFKRDISLFSLPWLGDRLTLSRSFRWGHAALPKPHEGLDIQSSSRDEQRDEHTANYCGNRRKDHETEP